MHATKLEKNPGAENAKIAVVLTGNFNLSFHDILVE
jgi:hypothetical protein